MPHPFLGIGFTSPLFSKFDREETEALLELTTKSDTTSYTMRITSTGSEWYYQIDWGDGNIEDFDETTISPGHGYSSPGVYEIKIYPVAPTDHLFFQPIYGEQDKITMVDGLGSPYWTSMQSAFEFHGEITSVSSSLNTSNAIIWYGTFYSTSNLTPFPLLDTSSATNMEFCWYNNSSLTTFPLIDTSNVTTMRSTWGFCTELTSFPPIDTSSVVSTGGNGTQTGFYATWAECRKLTSFPTIDVSSATKLFATWYDCRGLTSFPTLDVSGIFNFQQAWFGCIGLTSFPTLTYTNGLTFILTWASSGLTSFPKTNSSTFPSAVTMRRAWKGCSALADIPAGLFDNCPSVTFFEAFHNCPALTPQSIENILVSIESNNTSNGTLGFGGTTAGESTWTSAALTAKASLVSRGWTIQTNP